MSSAVVVKMPEALDASNARKLGRELKSRMAGDASTVVLDVSRVREIDLSGIESLLACMEEVARHDGNLQLFNVSPDLATLLELTRVNQLMQKFPGFSVEAPQFEVAPDAEPENVSAESPAQLPVAA